MEDDNEKSIPLLNYSFKNDHFLCTKCDTAPKLQIDEKNKIFLIQCCDKDKKTLIDIKHLKQDYIIESDELEVLKCKFHFLNFKEYCQNCMKNFCEKCEKCNHIRENLDNKNLEDSIESLKNIFFPKKEENNNNKEEEIMFSSITRTNIDNESELLKMIVSIIINDYLRVKNYHLYFSIKNLANYYKKSHPSLKLENPEPKFCINSPQELKDSTQITKVELYQYFFDLNKLNVSLPNLTELSLKNNNISDVKILINCNFNNLEKLILDINKIDDNILTYMKDMKFEKLKILSLKQNYLTDYKIFEEIKVFKNLKNFDVSSNIFKNKNFFENKTIDLNKIEELILSNGVFDDSSISNISTLQLNNLKTLDLSCNNLSSLEFILYSNWPKLNKLILNENDISDINELIEKFNNFPNKLTIIIENNLIKDETQINNLIESNSQITIIYKLISEIAENDNEQNSPSTDITQ